MVRDIKKILVTGALGQIGSELTVELRKRYGSANVIASDIKSDENSTVVSGGPWRILDVTDIDAISNLIREQKINMIFHMAAILSATGEMNPLLCWRVNMDGTLNILETAREESVDKVIIPSSIAAFGPDTPRENTPQKTILRPKTIYGVTKVSGELLCDYYVDRYGVDVRGLRYPGIISSETPPGGGTTDYAVEIYYKAIEEGRYTCFVRRNTMLPMMYMPDCIKATLDLADAEFDNLSHHSDFNVGALSVTAGDIAESIKKFIPDFEVTYEPDFRQEIADTWPSSIDDSMARKEWGWEPDWDLDSMTADMLEKLKQKL